MFDMSKILSVLRFDRVLIPVAAMPYFWRSWMPYVTPFRYLLHALLGITLHNEPIRQYWKDPVAPVIKLTSVLLRR